MTRSLRFLMNGDSCSRFLCHRSHSVTLLPLLSVPVIFPIDSLYRLHFAEGDDAKKKGKKASRKKKKKRNRRPGEAHDYSDSEEEEERVALFWEGKHRPCERTAWVVAKWTLTKKEARREVRLKHWHRECACAQRPGLPQACRSG